MNEQRREIESLIEQLEKEKNEYVCRMIDIDLEIMRQRKLLLEMEQK